jgi:hypothetical protein
MATRQSMVSGFMCDHPFVLRFHLAHTTHQEDFRFVQKICWFASDYHVQCMSRSVRIGFSTLDKAMAFLDEYTETIQGFALKSVEGKR